MNHAFLVLCHEKPIVLERTIALLSGPNHYFFIHVDKKYDDLGDFDRIRILKNVFFVKRIVVNWGSFNMVKATLFLMKIANEFDVRFDYFHLISGSDFPCISNEYFDSYFNKAINRSYLAYDAPQNIELCNYRMNSFHLLEFFDLRKSKYLFIKDKMELILNRFLLRNDSYKWYKGAQWFSFYSDVVTFILKFVRNNPSYLRRFKYTECCDELFFHTLLHPYIDELKIDTTTNLRYIDWNPDRPVESLPLVLEEMDFVKIKDSRALLCRKIDPIKSEKLIYLLEAYILQYHK